MERLLLADAVIIGVPAATVGYIVLAEKLLGLLPERRQWGIRPWLWLAPALILLTVFLVYPSLNTLMLSFFSADSSQPVGLANYVFVFTDPGMLTVLRNNLIWVVFFTAVTVVLGLVIAVLTDRV